MKALAGLQVLSEDGERVLCRGWRADGDASAALAVYCPSPSARPRLPRSPCPRIRTEGGARQRVGGAAAGAVREGGRTVLVLEDPGGEPLERLLGAPMETGSSCASPSASPPRWARPTSAASCTRTSSRPISW